MTFRTVLLTALSLATLTIGLTNVSAHAQTIPTATIITQKTGTQFKPYKTRLRPHSHVAYKRYATGGYGTSAGNLKPIGTSIAYRGHTVTVTGTQTSKSVAHGRQSWVKIKTANRQLGWINVNAIDAADHQLIGVPLIAQRPQLPTGCEITAVTMMLNYAGDSATKMQLAKQMPRSTNPNKGFVGSPYKKSGWYIYPQGLMPLVKRHLGSARNLTNASTATLKRSLVNAHPFVIWLAHVDGFSNHALTVTGYNHQTWYLNDPWKNKRITLSNATLRTHWAQDHHRALSY